MRIVPRGNARDRRNLERDAVDLRRVRHRAAPLVPDHQPCHHGTDRRGDVQRFGSSVPSEHERQRDQDLDRVVVDPTSAVAMSPTEDGSFSSRALTYASPDVSVTMTARS